MTKCDWLLFFGLLWQNVFFFVSEICLLELSFCESKMSFYHKTTQLIWKKWKIACPSVLDSFFLAHCGKIFYSPRNIFFWTIFLWNKLICLKKCKNVLKDGVLRKKVLFFLPIFTHFLVKYARHFFFDNFLQIWLFTSPGNIFIRIVIL